MLGAASLAAVAPASVVLASSEDVTTPLNPRAYFQRYPTLFAPFYGDDERATLLKTVVPDRVWCLEQNLAVGPLETPLRCVVIRLKDDSLWVHDPLAPTEEFLLERVHPAQALEGKTKLLYRSALANFNKVHKSTGQYCYETVNKAKVYTSIYTNVEGEEAVNTTNYRQIYKALDWQLVDKLGDYYKVLRARPTPRNRETKPISFEYLPNNV